MSRSGSARSTPNYDIGKNVANVGDPLPEQWTLVKQWHMERREPFESWRSLTNSQIDHLYKQMMQSVAEHPSVLEK